MDEIEFVNSIDCRFPYADLEAGLRIADLACSISPNAAFAVVDEVVRPPLGSVTDAASQLAVLDRLSLQLTHPIAPVVFALAKRLVAGDTPTVPEAIAAMHIIAAHPGQYAALSIAYMACDDTLGHADAEYNRIVQSWNAA